MKFDRLTITVFAAMFVAVMFWTPFCRWMGWISVPEAAAVAPQSPAGAATVTAAPPAVPLPAPVDSAPLKLEESLQSWPEMQLSNESVTVDFLPAEGAVKAITLLQYQTSNRERNLVLDSQLSNYLKQPGALEVYGDQPWTVVEILDNSVLNNGRSYRLERKLSTAQNEHFFLRQEWELSGDYELNYTVSLRSLTGRELIIPKLAVSGGDLQPWHILSGDQKLRTDSNTIDLQTALGDSMSINIDDDAEDFAEMPESTVQWVAMSNKYFTTVLWAEEPFALVKQRAQVVEKNDAGKYYLALIGGAYHYVRLAPDQESVFKFKYYAGPKILDNLKAFNPACTDLMHLSFWGPISLLAEWLLSFLIFLKGWCGSYGISIILLTVVVRAIFWPLTYKANASMRKMSLVQPKIAELREKYKDQPQLMNTKMMELYRDEKINPLGGCLPILLQIPVFLALYSALNSAVELRQVSFLWAANLAAPDTVAVIPLGMFDLPINPLVLAMTALMVVQQLLTPSAMDPMQKKMMLFMPVIMLFFFYDLPSGLTLYWTVSQIFSIGQMYLQRRLSPGSTEVKK